MKDLPNDWYERSMAPLREEAKTWPDWMRKGVDEARDRAERRMAEYRAQTPSEKKPELG